MADRSNIEWTDSTFNPWMGCTKVSPACDHCYAENLMDNRMHTVQWGKGQPRKRTSAKNWKLPLQWNAAPFYKCITCGWRGDQPDTQGGSLTDGLHSCPDCNSMNITRARRRVFCASLADVFDKEVPDAWLADLLVLINATPNLDWLLLTKRIGNFWDRVHKAGVILNLRNDVGGGSAGDMAEGWIQQQPPENVWIGATICNQSEALRDIPKLLEVPAKIRFVSIEPLLAPVDLDQVYLSMEHALWIDWAIVGGESGPEARPMHPAWVNKLRDQCQGAGVPFLFKQWGEWAPRKPVAGGDEGGDLRKGIVRYLQGDGREPDGHFRRGDAAMRRVGKKEAGRLLDGITHTEFPKVAV